MRIMVVEQVYFDKKRVKILCGRLERDVKVGDFVKIGSHSTTIMAIHCFGKMVDSQRDTHGVGLCLRGIKDLPVEEGWEIHED